MIIPAIDLQDGCVVRYVQGKKDKKVYSRDPVKTARYWVRQGAERLHVVDLDGAFSGIPRNIGCVEAIVKAVSVPVQCGGGVRTHAVIRKLLGAGVASVILGTKAVQDEVFLRKALAQGEGRVMVSVDAAHDHVLTKGWKSAAGRMCVVPFIHKLQEFGLDRVVFTDTTRDGTLKGVNVKDTRRILKATGIRIIVSGGVSTLEDIRRVKRIAREGVIGVIVGKALYEGRFTLVEALKIAGKGR